MSKIVIIGAGSLVFSSRLTADILSYESLAGSHFALVDIDRERLDYAGNIVETIFKEGHYPDASVSTHTERAEAFAGADYVIISILVGGYEAIKSEIDIPAAYGIDQCIGDTLTPGGVMRCLRTLPVLLGIAADIAAVCPEAVVMNYTNPMGMLSLGISEAFPGLKYVGLCHSVSATAEEWAGRLEVPYDEVSYLCGGKNHQAWFTRFEHNKKDLLPQMRRLAEKPEIWYGDSARMEFLKHFVYPVTESSGHVSEYNPWFRKNSTLVERYCNDKYSEWNGGHAFIKTLYERPDWKEQMEKMAGWETPIDLSRSREYGSQIIFAIESGQPAVIYGNVRNKGYIDNLPEGALVEVPCLVDRNGIQPVRIGELPHHLAAINSGQLPVQELAVKAVQTADPELVFQAMCLDPLTAMSCTLDEIRAMTIELMSAHAKWIPSFGGRVPEVKPLMYKTAVSSEVEQHIDPSNANKI